MLSPQALYWLASVFCWLFFTGIGIPPVPEEAGILYASGVTALHSEVPWWAAWPAASLGIIAADLVLYGAGRWLGARIWEYRWVNRMLSPERRHRLEKQFHEHGLQFLLMARLLPPLRTGVFLIAGSVRFSLARFLLADTAYGVVGVGLIFFGGTAILEVAHRLGGWLVLIAALIASAYLLWRYYRYLKRLELKASVEVAKAAAEVVSPPPSDGQSAAGSKAPDKPPPAEPLPPAALRDRPGVRGG